MIDREWPGFVVCPLHYTSTSDLKLVGRRCTGGIERRLQLLFLFVRQRGLDHLAVTALNFGQHLVGRRLAQQNEEQRADVLEARVETLHLIVVDADIGQCILGHLAV